MTLARTSITLLFAFAAIFEASLAAAPASRSLTAIPDYVRGKDYKWILSEAERDNGITYLGAHERLRKAMNKLKKGEKLKVGAIGGSITAGQGCVDAPNWPQYIFNFLQDTYGEANVAGNNGAVAGTISGYMSVCHNMHVPKDVDIIFVEYSVNDWHNPIPTFENNVRRPFERLLRKLLKYPNRPAVVMMHSFVWYQAYPHIGAFWNNAEREFTELASYYHLPSLSVKACCYQKMVNEEEGFSITSPRNKDQIGLAGKSFYYDPIHPDGRTGARVMGELGMHLLQKTFQSLEAKPLVEQDGVAAEAKLPRPMIPDNFESVSDKCFIGIHFTETVKTKDGWEWINESKTERPKWGFVTTTAGSVLKMHIDTMASAPAAAHGSLVRASQAGGTSTDVLIELAYLRSYEHMGKAQVTCEGDCKCESTQMDGHHGERNSQLFLFNFYATQASNCVVVVTVLPETSSGEHKFKLAGIMISEEAGQHEGIKNHAAVEYVGDISQRSKDGTFDAKNHAR